jgi:hypothetical protein
MNANQKSSPKHIYAEREKLMHTSHWDMDYLSIPEIDALYGQQPRSEHSLEKAPVPDKQPLSRRQAGLMLIVVGLALLLAGLGLGRLL